MDSLNLENLKEVKLRFSAELGRAALPLGKVTEFKENQLIVLDRDGDEPIDIYVSGKLFAKGSLRISGGEWVVKVERLEKS